MKNINVNVPTRLMILMNLPEQGSVVEMIAVRNLRKKVDFDSKETEDISLKTDGGKVTWNNAKAKDKAVEFSEAEIDLLNKIINKIDKAGQVTEILLDFIEALRA